MITIEFNRFVLEPETETTLVGFSRETHRIQYHAERDHAVTRCETDCPIERARLVAHRFLKDHYGNVIITIDNSDEWTHTVRIKLCNHKKFWRDMIARGLLVVKHARA